MKTVICPKCNEVIVVSNNKNFVICCDEVINITDEAHDRETQE